jgi:hypothetical protein
MSKEWSWEAYETVCGQTWEEDACGPHGETIKRWRVHQPYAYAVYCGQTKIADGLDHADLEYWQGDDPPHDPKWAQFIVDGMNAHVRNTNGTRS